MKTRKNSHRALAVTALAALSLSAAACNTVQGLGEDISSVGEAGEEVIKGDD
ncbi:MAG: Entericidin EcnA/B family protein [Pseudomonadota bacterium]